MINISIHYYLNTNSLSANYMAATFCCQGGSLNRERKVTLKVVNVNSETQCCSTELIGFCSQIMLPKLSGELCELWGQRSGMTD